MGRKLIEMLNHRKSVPELMRLVEILKHLESQNPRSCWKGEPQICNRLTKTVNRKIKQFREKLENKGMRWAVQKKRKKA